jgi:hypothetical protein
MKEMRQLAWISGVIPLQRIVANELRDRCCRSSSPRRRAPPSHALRLGRGAAALGDADREAHAIREDFKAQMIKRSEARLETGRAAGPEDEVYVASSSAQPQKPDAAPAADAKEPTDA